MTDAREALVARQREEFGESWDVLVPEVGWTLGRIIESTIEDVLAEFDVTERAPMDPGFEDHEAYCHLQHGMGGPCSCKDAPATPDSTDVRDLADRIETAMTDGGHRMPRTDETRYLAHVAAQTALAVVGQGVAVEWGVGYGDRHEAAPSREDAEEWIADDDAWNPGEERWLVMRQVGSWTRAAASPEGRGRDDRP